MGAVPPSLHRAHHGGDGAGLGGRALNLAGGAPGQGGGHRRRRLGAVQNLTQRLTVMSEIGVHSQPTPIAATIGPGQRVPQRRRGLAIDLENALTVELQGGVPAVRAHRQGGAGGRAPDFAGGHGTAGDGRLGQAGDGMVGRIDRGVTVGAQTRQSRWSQAEVAPNGGQYVGCGRDRHD